MPGGLQMHFWQQLLRQPTGAGNVSLTACLPRPTEAHHTYALATDYGRMIKVSKYQKHISKFSFEPKDKRKISALGFLKLGQKFFVRFLVQMKTFKSPFDIY